MRKLKIFICCPGSWSAGLNSPERGEGRWAQNWARLLGNAGHEVTACSAGNNAQRYVENGVCLIGEHEKVVDGPYDIYIDPTWWEGKEPKVESRFYFRCYWSLEAHLRKPGLPNNHCIIYPYRSTAKFHFLNECNPYIDRTFHMPVPLRSMMAQPAFDRKDIFFPTHASPAEAGFPDNAKIAVDKIYSYIDAGQDFKCHWLFGEFIKKNPYVKAAVEHKENTVFYPRLPYNVVVSIIDQCKLSVQLNSCSCAVDAVVAGVPFVAWENGGFFTEVAKDIGICIGRDEETKERIEQVIDILMTDRDIYVEYVNNLQNLLYGHTEDSALEIFNSIVETMNI